MIEPRGGIATKPYLGVDQTVIISARLFDRSGGYGAVAQSQLQIEVFSSPPDRMHNALDLHPLAVFPAAQQVGQGDSRRDRR
jgi:hypothetical protein